MNNKIINQIAGLITEDPNIFNEATQEEIETTLPNGYDITTQWIDGIAISQVYYGDTQVDYIDPALDNLKSTHQEAIKKWEKEKTPTPQQQLANRFKTSPDEQYRIWIDTGGAYGKPYGKRLR